MNMNIIISIFVFLLSSIFISMIQVKPLLAFNDGINAPLTEKEEPQVRKIVILYNKLIAAFKANLRNITTRFQEYLLNLLIVFAFGSLVFIVARSFISGDPLSATLIYKLIMFVVLGLLLQIDFFTQNVLNYLILLFDSIPTLFSDIKGTNIIDNIINQTSEIITQINKKIDTIGWGWNVLAYIFAFLAILGVLSMMLIVLLNVLEISFYFYTTVCLSSIFILLYFFKTTRNYSISAINFLVTSLFNIAILSLFLSIIGELIKTLLVYEESLDFITNCTMVLLITIASNFLLLRIKNISQAITSQGLATITPSISTLYRKFTNK